MHCALLHTQTTKNHGCNEFVHCCMLRPQSILFHIASMANTQMSLSHSRYLQCHLKICYIYGPLWSGYVTIRNAQCNNSEDNLFELGVYACMYVYMYVCMHVCMYVYDCTCTLRFKINGGEHIFFRDFWTPPPHSLF